MQVTIVGAGLGGLATAIRLARQGYTVKVYEKNGHYGGKVCEKKITTSTGNFRWDCGPSLLTLPQTFQELFEYCDQRLENYLTLVPSQPICRYFWRDGKVIDEDDRFWRRPEVVAYLNYAKGIYELAGETFLNYAPRKWGGLALHPKRWKALRHFSKVATFQTLDQLHQRFFSDPYLRQIFNRFATYNGSSPYQTPATFAIIPYVEAEFGGWHVLGGMARVAESLYQLACKMGVVFHFNQEIKNLSEIKSDVVVCNGDIIQTHNCILNEVEKVRDLQSKPLACSGYIVWLAVKKTFPRLAHHNIFFGDDYKNEFHSLFEEKQLFSEPTIYLSITSKTDANDAPAGCENWFLLVNSPAYDRLQTDHYGKNILKRLEKFGLELKPEDILHQETFTVHDFIKRDNAWQGSLYGWASHSISTALLRPSLRHPYKKNIFFVGGTVHPGGGMPLVLLSGKIVADEIFRFYPLN